VQGSESEERWEHGRMVVVKRKEDFSAKSDCIHVYREMFEHCKLRENVRIPRIEKSL
jgi:hypothetical protein